jgi:hypothetical protein
MLLAAGAIAAVLCAGCAGNINVAGAVLTSGAAMSQGKRTPATQFTHDDFIVMLVDFTWPNAEDNGGSHKCDWRWYRDGQLVSKSPTKIIRFKSTPFSLRTSRAAATLGTGHFKVETIVDDNVVATSEFDIAS